MPDGGNLYFQLVYAHFEKGAITLTFNRGFAAWGEGSAIPLSPPP